VLPSLFGMLLNKTSVRSASLDPNDSASGHFKPEVR
jgi:hypothetical protein